jgi:hypothetical protein
MFRGPEEGAIFGRFAFRGGFGRGGAAEHLPRPFGCAESKRDEAPLMACVTELVASSLILLCALFEVNACPSTRHCFGLG